MAALVLALLAGCSGHGQEKASPAASPQPPSPAASPVPARSARQTFADFVSAVTDGRLDDAWSLYAANTSEDPSQYRPDLGCDFSAFSFEFPKIQHFFARGAPFKITESYGAPGADTIELSLSGKDGQSYLATLVRAEAAGPYLMRFLNSGRVSKMPGVPDAFPSPDDPLGACGIWPGAR